MKVLSALQRYGPAVVSCGVAVAIAWVINAPTSCFLLAVAVSSTFGGLGPGLLSIGLSAVAFNYLFLRRTMPPSLEPAVFFRFAVFLLAMLLIALLVEVKRRVEDSGKRAEQALRQANLDLARVSRVTTMGELTASLAHEVNQPIAASITDANTCLRWLMRDPPDLAEAREAASRTVKDVARAAEIISRVRRLFKKDTPRQELVDINETIRETTLLLHSEATQHGILVRTDLAAMLPQVMGDRVQLQQVFMNLMMNSIDAMKNVDGARELTIQSRRSGDDQVLISVSDSGVGLPPQDADQIFNAFFTTKPQGTGMGLRISRSIMESHRGRLWAAANPHRGATFHLTLPTKVEAHE